jgi:hypothetical protein
LVIATTVTFTMTSGGGFDASSRSTFVALAGVCLLVAGAIGGRTVIQAARSPLALTLAALAALSVVSVVWTIGSHSAALRWGLVIGGYAAVFIATATLTEAMGPWPVAAGVAGLALLEALLGLGAVAFHALPDAERLGGVWRPGGTFEYPPALALLEVGALPVLSCALDRCRAPIAGAAAVAATLAGVVLGLANSRLALALGAALLVSLILRPLPGRHPRTAAAAMTSLVVIGWLLGPVVLGGNVGPSTPGVGSRGATEIAVLAVAAGGVWLLVRRMRVPIRTRWGAGGACVAAIALVVVASTSTGSGSHAPAVREPSAAARSDFLHGRAHEWSAALETWVDRPVLGAGADAYYVASLSHQTVARSRFAHSLPLELAAELGALGLLLGLAIYASTAWTITKAMHASAMWLLAPAVAAFLASNLLDWTWHLAGLGALWAAASGSLSVAHGDLRGIRIRSARKRR